MKRKSFYALAVVWLMGMLVFSSAVQAKTIFKSKYNSIKLVAADAQLTGNKPLSHPAEISEQKLYNMLASIRFDKNSLVFKDKDDLRLFDQRGLKMLSPYLAQAFRQVNPEQMVAFTYIKKAPIAKVLRNDRLISGKMYVRDGELFIRFNKLYAKIFSDYQRAGQQHKLNQANDVRVSLDAKGGQRTLGSKIIALRIDYDYLSDLRRQAEEERRHKEETKAAEEIRGIPLPEVATKGEETTAESDLTSKQAASPIEKGDVATRLKTLEELRDKGLISEREYQNKRKEILGEL